MDIKNVVAQFVRESILTEADADYIINTQFRSYDFVPRVAAYLLKNKEGVPHEKMSIEEVADAPHAIWWVDNFGNCKTTLERKDITSETPIETKLGSFDYYKQLKDVPDDTVAIITGSSGIGEHRFLEIVMQGGSVAQKIGAMTSNVLL